MTTKKQEREALQQIKEIIEALGPDSYIAVALDGCLEIAEQNIDNDFACSMKQRAESARDQVEALKEENRNLREQIEEKDKKIDKQRDAISQLNGIIRQAESKQLSRELYKKIWTAAYDQEEASKKQMLNSADYMAQLSEHPNDIAFGNAVKMYKKAKASAETASWIMEELDKIKPEGC